MAMEKTRKGKRKFEKKKEEIQLCREDMDVTEELKTEGLLLQIKVYKFYLIR